MDELGARGVVDGDDGGLGRSSDPCQATAQLVGELCGHGELGVLRWGVAPGLEAVRPGFAVLAAGLGPAEDDARAAWSVLLGADRRQLEGATVRAAQLPADLRDLHVTGTPTASGDSSFLG